MFYITQSRVQATDVLISSGKIRVMKREIMRNWNRDIGSKWPREIGRESIRWLEWQRDDDGVVVTMGH